MASLKNIEQLVNLLEDTDPLKEILSEIHQTLEWFYEWFQKLGEEISTEN